MKINKKQIKILRSLISGEKYGLEISKETNLNTGSLYPSLYYLENRDLVVSRWAEPIFNDIERGGARRRFYALTTKGREFILDYQEPQKKSMFDWLINFVR